MLPGLAWVYFWIVPGLRIEDSRMVNDGLVVLVKRIQTHLIFHPKPARMRLWRDFKKTRYPLAHRKEIAGRTCRKNTYL